MSAALQVFNDFYLSLVQSLPLNDDLFLARLHSEDLLTENSMDKLQSLSSPVEKATHFLDQVIESSLKNDNITPLTKLLKAMEDHRSGLKRLAVTIRSELSCHGYHIGERIRECTYKKLTTRSHVVSWA